MTQLATQCPEKRKNLYHKRSHQEQTQKRHFSETQRPKSKTLYSRELSANPQRINNPKTRRCVF